LSNSTIHLNSDSGLPAGLELQRKEDYWRAQFTAMACPCQALIDTTDAAAARRSAVAVAAEAWRIEHKYSRYLTDNVVHAINTAAGHPVEVDEETVRLLDFATDLHQTSDGLFDISSGVLRKVWHFDGSDRLPEAAAVREILKLVGWQRVHWHAPRLQMPAGMQIDLGGIGKEYAVDRAAQLGSAAGDAPLLVNFGGDIVATGPRLDGRAWKVSIESVAPDRPTPLIELRRGGVATSGDARRYLLKDGVRYGHILDPRDGWPVRDAARSVTVLEANCTQAGVLSTLAILQGSGAEKFLRKHKVTYWIAR
jgi:thiamine biosynthesis lipoprotein